ncbi:hypothetical protein MMPV_009307 [Pyropia vietnamensis]
MISTAAAARNRDAATAAGSWTAATRFSQQRLRDAAAAAVPGSHRYHCVPPVRGVAAAATAAASVRLPPAFPAGAPDHDSGGAGGGHITAGATSEAAAAALLTRLARAPPGGRVPGVAAVVAAPPLAPVAAAAWARLAATVESAVGPPPPPAPPPAPPLPSQPPPLPAVRVTPGMGVYRPRVWAVAAHLAALFRAVAAIRVPRCVCPDVAGGRRHCVCSSDGVSVRSSAPVATLSRFCLHHAHVVVVGVPPRGARTWRVAGLAPVTNPPSPPLLAAPPPTPTVALLFHAAEFPAACDVTFPHCLGWCQAGSPLRWTPRTRDTRNVLWVCPPPSAAVAAVADVPLGAAWWADLNGGDGHGSGVDDGHGAPEPGGVIAVLDTADAAAAALLAPGQEVLGTVDEASLGGIVVGDVLFFEDGLNRGAHVVPYVRWPNVGEVCE